jgi:hypothetical protein
MTHSNMQRVEMIDLSPLAHRFGLTIDGPAIVCGEARIVQPLGADFMTVSTCDPATAQRLDDSGVGTFLYRQPVAGRLSLAFNPRRLGEVIAALEQGAEEPMPSYGRNYRS